MPKKDHFTNRDDSGGVCETHPDRAGGGLGKRGACECGADESCPKCNRDPAEDFLEKSGAWDVIHDIRGEPVDGEPDSEAQHFYTCPTCGQAVDARRLADVLHHEERGHRPFPLNS